MDFLEQFKALAKKEPRLAAYNFRDKNCSYSNFLVDSENCHYCFNSGDIQNSTYAMFCNHVENSSDLNNCELVENCYECSDSSNIKNCKYLINCVNCANCDLSEDLLACKYCFACVGLYKKKFHIYNIDYKNKKNYLEEITRITNESSQTDILKKIQPLREKVPRINMQLADCETCAGDYLFDCKGCQSAYNSTNLHLGSYCEEIDRGFFCVDTNNCSNITDCYDCSESTDLNFGFHCFFVSNSSSMILCTHCFNCENCIGCINQKNKKYCILNKEYEEEEYRKKAKEILKELYKNGPIQLTDFYQIIPLNYGN